MAEVGAMCSMRRSCAIVEDDGLSASYTVAHEVNTFFIDLVVYFMYRNILFERTVVYIST